jgi:hypothetical protein
MKQLIWLILGGFFGIVLYKSEVISWYRIMNMFEFKEFHMYGVIGSAVLTGIIGLQIMKGANSKTSEGIKIEVKKKDPSLKRALIGGTFFGCGWALTGACPAPIMIHIASGTSIFIIVFIFALIGAYTYLKTKHRLPH